MDNCIFVFNCFIKKIFKLDKEELILQVKTYCLSLISVILKHVWLGYL